MADFLSKYTGEEIEERLDSAGFIPLVPILYADLITARDTKLLKAGQRYRIIDYRCTTTQEGTQDAGHQFDIIVTALDEGTLSENASAIQHEGDTYFNDCNLEAWELKYCLDNDTNRFAWADTGEGKGVIWYMKDEYNNECPYDFKNIQYKRWRVHFDEDSKYYEKLEGKFLAWSTEETNGWKQCIDSEYIFAYTFNDVDFDGSNIKDLSLDGKAYNNSIESMNVGESHSSSGAFGFLMMLNNISFVCTKSESSGGEKNVIHNNIFLSGCYYMSFSRACYNNSFGNFCGFNSFGNGFVNNSFGDECLLNSFGNNCDYNSFGDYCGGISFGNDCEGNSFGIFLQGISFGNDCGGNSFIGSSSGISFGNYCDDNLFEINCNRLSFGDSCCSNTFGNNCTDSSFGYECKGNSFGNSCQYLDLSAKEYLRLYHFDNGISGKSETSRLIPQLTEDNIVQYNVSCAKHFDIENQDLENSTDLDIYKAGDIGDSFKVIKISYNDLLNLKNNSNLSKGQKYRITDYQCTTIQENTQSANHQFDIIVTALDVNILSEDVSAIQHEGDTYFENCVLESWELKYCLDNDDKRFAWADVINGKGVIWYMKDEYNNECPYDFKNIQYKVFKIEDAPQANLVGQYLSTIAGDTQCTNIVASETDFVWAYTFDCLYDGNHIDLTAQVSLLEDPTDDTSWNKVRCHDNSLGQVKIMTGGGGEFKIYSRLGLNYTTFINTEFACYGNKIGCNSPCICFGNKCYGNEIKGNLSSQGAGQFMLFIFRNYCARNSFGNGCYSISFGTDCYDNSFGNDCYSHSLGNNCSSNTFGNGCYGNSFGNDCYSNSFGNDYRYNSLGNNCVRNSFGTECYDNSFGNDYHYNSLGNSCQYLDLSTKDNLKLYHFDNGIKGTNDSTKRFISQLTAGNTVQYNVSYAQHYDPGNPDLTNSTDIDVYKSGDIGSSFK